MAKKDKGRWITTDEGRHIHLGEDGKPDRGNPYVIAAMKGSGSKGKSDGDEAKSDKWREEDGGVVPVGSNDFTDSYKMRYVYDPVEMDPSVVAKAVEESKRTGNILMFNGEVVRLSQRPENGDNVIVRMRGEHGGLELYNRANVISEAEAKKTMDWDDVDKRFRRR